MGFLSRKKPKPAPVDIQEEPQIVDDLQRMEELVPERTEEYAFEVPTDEGPAADLWHHDTRTGGVRTTYEQWPGRADVAQW